MPKFHLDALDLIVTAPAACAPWIQEVAESILLLLQFDGNPVGCCDAVINAATTAGPAEPPCLIALCVKTQLFASVMLEMDTSVVEKILDDPSKSAQYEPWEIQHARMVVEFAKGRFERALDIGEEAQLVTPNDIFTTRALFVTYFLTSSMDRMRRNIVGLVRYYEMRSNLAKVFPYILGMSAFALEESGSTEAALRMANRAIELVGKLNADGVTNASGTPLAHPYAMHVLCHCYLTFQQPQAGLDAIASIPAALWVPTQHLVIHCWWHIALFHHDLGHSNEALEVYDTKMLQHVNKDDPYALSDASALLMRLYVDNILDRNDHRLPPLTAMWSHWAPAETCVARPPATVSFSFFDYNLRVHELLVGTKLGDGGVASSTLLGGELGNRRGAVAQKAVIDATRVAVDNADYFAAVEILEGARALWGTLGGSNGQRDILTRLLWHLKERAANCALDRDDAESARRLAGKLLAEINGERSAFGSTNPHFGCVASRLETLIEKAK